MFWTQTRPDNRTLAAVVGSLVTLAWLSIATWSFSPYDRYLHHGSLDDLTVGVPAAAAIFVGGWALMVVAMMLPTTYPVLALFRGVIRQRDDRALLLSLCLAGYLVVWVAFGAAAYAADLGLHGMLERGAWIDERPWLIGTAVLALAGAYQFAPLKYRCLEQCRLPRMFVLRHWTGRTERRGSFALGLDSGVFCVGCCWSLMLLMFAVGAGSIPWMLMLATMMAIEKNVPWGDQISRPLGASLLIAATLAAVDGVLAVP
jgi:predicted metal-binding membrane protein